MADILATIILFILAEHFILVIAMSIFLWLKRRWNIPVIIFRFVGDKRRPNILIRRARKKTHGAINLLFVKGYDLPIRDFKAVNYYPAEKSINGALILWEFKRGWLTPATPELKEIPQALRQEYSELLAKIREETAHVSFEYDPEMYNKLIVKAIDDIDAEWNLRQHQRINSQYASGWRDFLSKYGGHMLVAVVAVCLLVGFIVWIKESPNWAGQCINAGVEAAKKTYLETLAGKIGGAAATGAPLG